MMRPHARIALLALLPISAICSAAQAQTDPAPSPMPTATTGSAGCTLLAQQAANGMTARVQADDQTIKPPTSVRNLTCLDNFFGGVGLNVVTSLLNPGSLLNTIEGQVCQLVQSEWNSTLGSAQCGITLTGFNLGFGGIGGGLSCPKLSFGGGGPPIGTVDGGAALNGGHLYINGTGTLPTGYGTSTATPGSF
jgi:hypothetical protein